MKIFYYADEYKNRFGPFSSEELKEKGISKNTLIWYEGLSEWTKAEDIYELKINFEISQSINKKPYLSPPPLISNSYNLVQKNTVDKLRFIRPILIIFLVILIISITFLYHIFNLKKQNKSLNKTVGNSVDYTQGMQDSITIESNKFLTRKNWYDLIILSRSKYNFSKLGGISNLSLTITNNTNYLIDNLDASVSFILNNGNIYKTEILHFHNIPSQSHKTLKVPDSDWGTSVSDLNIISVSSKAFNFCLDNRNLAKNSEDPYRCQ